jgi:hypothetical protein
MKIKCRNQKGNPNSEHCVTIEGSPTTESNIDGIFLLFKFFNLEFTKAIYWTHEMFLIEYGFDFTKDDLIQFKREHGNILILVIIYIKII